MFVEIIHIIYKDVLSVRKSLSDLWGITIDYIYIFVLGEFRTAYLIDFISTYGHSESRDCEFKTHLFTLFNFCSNRQGITHNLNHRDENIYAMLSCTCNKYSIKSRALNNIIYITRTYIGTHYDLLKYIYESVEITLSRIFYSRSLYN